MEGSRKGYVRREAGCVDPSSSTAYKLQDVCSIFSMKKSLILIAVLYLTLAV